LSTRESEAQSSAAKVRAEASFKKEERAKEGAKAMLEYQAGGREVREQMARLRALRLAKEEADQKAAEAAKSAAKPVKSAAKSAAKPSVKPVAKAAPRKAKKLAP
jgi:hypothetical protein